MPSFQGINLEGDYIPLNYLNPISQNYVKKFEGLVLIREKIIDNHRLTGTLWYKQEVIGFTVEDVPRKLKIANETSIEATLNFASDSILPPDKGPYNITLDTTESGWIAKGYVQFPDDPNPKFKSPGVVPRIGTDSNAYRIKSTSGDLDFGGIRIHQGSNEDSTEGCLIFSRQRKDNGTVKTDLEINKILTQLIYNNKIDRIVYINEFSLPKDKTFKVTGKVVDSLTLQPIPYPIIKYFPTYNPPLSGSLIPPDLIDMYKSKSITGEGNKTGEFSIEIPSISEYLSTKGSNSSLLIQNSKLEVTITAPGYDITEKTPLKADGTFKSNLGVIELPSFEVIRREVKLIENEITDEQMEVLGQFDNIKKEFIELQTETLLKTIKGKLTPFIIKQIADLGVPDPIGLLKKAKDFKKKAEKYEKKQNKKNQDKNQGEGLANEPTINQENT